MNAVEFRERIDQATVLIRVLAKKWNLGYRIERATSSNAYEVRFGKELPLGVPGQSYFVAIELRPQNAAYWHVEISAAVESMVQELVRCLKPHPGMTALAEGEPP